MDFRCRKIYGVEEKLPYNNEQVIAINENLVLVGSWTNGKFIFDNTKVFGVITERERKKNKKAILIKSWFPLENILEA